jgi:hypothetical protein
MVVPAFALTCDTGARIRELLIDPTTGQYAGERDTARDDPRWPVEPAAVLKWSSTITAITDEPGVLPQHLAEQLRVGLPT